MVEGRTVRIIVRTAYGRYVGDFFLPASRKSVFDTVDDDRIRFINLTNVVIDETQRVKFVSLNKSHIESIAPL